MTRAAFNEIVNMADLDRQIERQRKAAEQGPTVYVGRLRDGRRLLCSDYGSFRLLAAYSTPDGIRHRAQSEGVEVTVEQQTATFVGCQWIELDDRIIEVAA